jgi:hypothetical protein
MEDNRVATITDWPEPQNVRDVQAFLGFTGFYRRFVEGYSKLCKGMSDLTKKLPGFKWTQAATRSLQTLKDAFTTEPVLKAYDPEKPSILRTNASGYALSGIHTQKHEGKEHPVEY